MKKPMTEHSRQLVQKLWNYATLLKDVGVSYGDYTEQLTYLLFLKMAHERTEPPRSEPSKLPEGLDWPALLDKSGAELADQYEAILEGLGEQPGLLGLIFRKASNKVESPATLRRLIVELIDKETWTGVDADIKGDAYEGLLERNASDTKSGAGQYFTPRSLTRAMTEVMRPQPGERISDPACGTGGFLLAAFDYIADNNQLDRSQLEHLRDEAFSGVEIVPNTARLCAMNLFLHGIGSSDINAEPPIHQQDALSQEPAEKVDLVLANPPFGKKSSITFIGEDGTASADADTITRDDFWATTSNKQLNFLQHIRSMLRIGGRAAVVLPDNVLFEGGAGETIRRRFLHDCDVHTILRLPTGIFYAQGVKANVVFFERKPASNTPQTKEVWVYDLRTNQNFTLKQRPMTREHLQPFVDAYKVGAFGERVEAENFKRYTYDEIAERSGFNLDLMADVKDLSLTDPALLPAPEVIAEQIVEDATAGLQAFAEMAAELAARDADTPSDDDVPAVVAEALTDPA